MIRCIIVLALVLLTPFVFAQKNDLEKEKNQMNERFSKTLYEKGDEGLANTISDSLKWHYNTTGHLQSLFAHYNTKGTLAYYQGEYPVALSHFNDALLLGKKRVTNKLRGVGFIKQIIFL
ncbi:MAG: hypothetical protein WEA99_04775, partial [Brumimicrobium sp.]